MMNGWKTWVPGGGGRRREDAAALHAALVAQARTPAFYSRIGVADTIDGRFDMLCLHGFLVLHRLKAEGEPAEQLGQALVDSLFLDLDRSLREMGVGDLSVGKRMKKMAQAFYGRAAAYEQAVGSDDPDALDAAVARNVFAGTEAGQGAEREIADYMRKSVAALSECTLDSLRSGQPRFAAVVPDEARHDRG